MTKIEMVFFVWGNFRVPYINGALTGDGSGRAQGYVSQILQWVAQTSVSDEIDNYSIVEAEVPITFTQMAALVSLVPETLEEAKDIVESHA